MQALGFCTNRWTRPLFTVRQYTKGKRHIPNLTCHCCTRLVPRAYRAMFLSTAFKLPSFAGMMLQMENSTLDFDMRLAHQIVHTCQELRDLDLKNPLATRYPLYFTEVSSNDHDASLTHPFRGQSRPLTPPPQALLTRQPVRLCAPPTNRTSGHGPSRRSRRAF